MDNGKISTDGALVNNKNIEVNISSASISPNYSPLI